MSTDTKYVTLFEGPDPNTPDYNLSCYVTALGAGDYGLFRDELPTLRDFSSHMGIDLTNLREFLNERDWIGEMFSEYVTEVQGGCGYILHGRIGQPQNPVEKFGRDLQDMLLELKHFFSILEEIEGLDYDSDEQNEEALDDFWYNANRWEYRKVGDMIKAAKQLLDSMKTQKHKVKVVYTVTRTIEVEAPSIDDAQREAEKTLPTHINLLGNPGEELIATFSHFEPEEKCDAGR